MRRGDMSGNLIIRFMVNFPTTLDDNQKQLLAKAFE